MYNFITPNIWNSFITKKRRSKEAESDISTSLYADVHFEKISICSDSHHRNCPFKQKKNLYVKNHMRMLQHYGIECCFASYKLQTHIITILSSSTSSLHFNFALASNSTDVLQYMAIVAFYCNQVSIGFVLFEFQQTEQRERKRDGESIQSYQQQ